MSLSSKELADFWRVTQRTIQNWIQAHERGLMPSPEDIPGMLVWELTATHQHPGFKARCTELRASGQYVLPEPKQKTAAAAWQKFKAERAGKKKGATEQITDLEEFRDFYAKTLAEAIDAGDDGQMKVYNELLLDTSNSIRQQKLAADKLGIEEGQLFTKDQLARFIRAFAFWSMRSIDAELSDLCKNIVGLKSVAEARKIVEPMLLSARFVKPFAKASRIESESALSGWMAEAMRDEVDNYIEDGAKEFDASP